MVYEGVQAHALQGGLAALDTGLLLVLLLLLQLSAPECVLRAAHLLDVQSVRDHLISGKWIQGPQLAGHRRSWSPDHSASAAIPQWLAVYVSKKLV